MVGESYTGENISCPDPERWLSFVCGQESAKANSALATHAAQCDNCAALLKEALAISSDNESPEEQAFLRDLKTSQPLWQKSEARRIAPPRPVARASSSQSWGAIAAALLVLIGGTVFWLFYRANQAPLGELAEAYTQHRSIELRVPGAAYAPLRVERGSNSTRSAELLTAEAQIERHLASRSEDWQWLHAKGRAELLEWNFDSATHDLNLASDLAPSTHTKQYAELLIDLATAYFERAQATQRPIDYRAALEDLSKAIQTVPSLASAYFNRALIFEKIPDYFHAIDDWKKYLTLDPTGAWADEARRNLAADSKKISDTRPDDPNRLAGLIEPQLDAAMQLLPNQPKPTDTAALLLRENGDRWLTDALASHSDPLFAAIAPMAESRSHLRVSAFPEETTHLLALQHGDVPAPFRVWITFEHLFRVTHEDGSPPIPANIDSAITLARERHYWWLLGQLLLEQSSLLVVPARWSKADEMSLEVLELARQHHFPLLEMRAAQFHDGVLTNNGLYRPAADISHQELELFWARPHPWMRAQAFYASMAWAEEGLGRVNSAMYCAETAAHIAELAGAVETQAVNLARAAGFAQNVGDSQRALDFLRQSRSIFAKLRTSPTIEIYRAMSEADYALGSGDDRQIAQFETVVSTSSNPWVLSPYLRALAVSDLRHNHFPAAEKRLRQAIAALSPKAQLSPRENHRWRMELGRNYRQLVSTLIAANRSAAAFDAWQEYLLADSRLLNGSLQCRSGTAVAEGEALTFARLQDRYALWHKSSNNLEFAWLTPDADSIDRLTRRYASLCANPSTSLSQIQSTGNELRASFSPLLSRAIANGLLVIQPDGDLARIPWLSLLGAKVFVTVTPLPLGVETSQRPLDLEHTLAIGADMISPARVSELQPLPDIAAELETVAAVSPRCAVLRGTAATPSNIATHLSAASLLHFAGHSITTPDGVALVVAPDNFPSLVSDTWQPDPRACSHLALAVFSTCSAARYEDVQTTAPQNLAHAFLLAGTPQVFAALWNVDSRATAFFMQNFYSGLHTGLTPETAAHAAALSVLHQPGWAHPYYWASFVLFAR